MDFNKPPRVDDGRDEPREDWEPYLTGYREDGQYLHTQLGDIARSKVEQLDKSESSFLDEYSQAGDSTQSFLAGVMPHEGVGQEVADDNTNAKVETRGESQMPELEHGDAYEQISESEKLEAER